MRRSRALFCGLTTAILVTLFTTPRRGEADDWPRFRGPNGSGISNEPVPTEWGPDKNVKWTVDLPGRGFSSPIVVGDRVFVTCYSGYGMSRDDVGEIANLKRHLVCIDRNKGDVLWTATVAAVLPEDPFAGAGVPSHGYASQTPVSDGERVYAFFGKSGVLAFDRDGNQLWQTSVGTESGPQQWGSAASPILYGDNVIVNASDEAEALIALDKTTGEVRWKKEAAGMGNSWGTPILMESDTGTEIVLAVPYEIWSFNADDGKFKWYAKGPEDQTASHSVVGAEGVVYTTGGRGGNFVAAKVGGSGEISDDDLVWQGRASGRFAMPVLYNGLLFNVSGGVLACYKASTGDRVFQHRLASGTPTDDSTGERGSQSSGPRSSRPQPEGTPRGGRSGRGRRGGGFGANDYASPVVAGGNLIITMNDGTFYVVKATDSYEPVATNTLAQDVSGFAGTPAVSDGELFVRSNSKLYCISEK